MGSYAGDVSVSENAFAFVPADVTIRRGDRIVFHNDDSVAHQVIVLNGPDADSPLPKQRPGDVAVLILSREGSVDIGCDLHPHMVMRVKVE